MSRRPSGRVRIRTFRENNEGIFKCSSCADKIRLSLTLIALLFSRHKRPPLARGKMVMSDLIIVLICSVCTRASVSTPGWVDRTAGGIAGRRELYRERGRIEHENFKCAALPEPGMNDSSIGNRRSTCSRLGSFLCVTRGDR